MNSCLQMSAAKNFRCELHTKFGVALDARGQRSRFNSLVNHELDHVGTCGSCQCRQTLIKRIKKHVAPPKSAEGVSPIRHLRAMIITAEPMSAAVA